MLIRSRWWAAILTMLLVIHPRPASAQEPASSFEQLRLLIGKDDAIRVRGVSGQDIEGRVIDVSSMMLALQSQGRRVEFRDSEVATISRRLGRHAKKGTLIGLVSGAAFVLIAGAPTGLYRESPALVTSVAVVYGGMGAGIGAAIGAAIKKENIIYRKRATASPTLVLAPLLSNGRRGLLATLRF